MSSICLLCFCTEDENIAGGNTEEEPQQGSQKAKKVTKLCQICLSINLFMTPLPQNGMKTFITSV